MSPRRQNSQRNSPNCSKPYTRNVTSLPPEPEFPQGIAQHEPTHSSNLESRCDLPTYVQYKQIEAHYIESLTPRRQAKALISQAMFDRIWDVLHKPESPTETAQFRFWARKMFNLSKTHKTALGSETQSPTDPQEVLLHDGLLVAIQEQIYDLLCYCHSSTGHGGRDKTCALIRKHYTWVPKDLVSNFIKSCPTCIIKKSGHSDPSVTAAAHAQLKVQKAMTTSSSYAIRSGMSSLQNMMASFHSHRDLAPVRMEGDWSLPGGPMDSPNSVMHNMTFDVHGHSIPTGNVIDSSARTPLEIESLQQLDDIGNGLQSHPMVRETTLYKGLPFGWQYPYDDFASAYAAFMEDKHNPDQHSPHPDLGTKLPRIPSISPLWGPDDIRAGDLGPNSSTIGSEIASDSEFQQHMAPESQGNDGYVPQIDPELLAISSDSAKDSVSFTVLNTDELVDVSEPSSASNKPSLPYRQPANCIKRATAPPTLNFESLGSQKSFQTLFAYRDSTDSGHTTPDSPNVNLDAWPLGASSPADSDGSSKLQLSPALMSTTHSVSPANSALVTPTDEYGGHSDGKDGLGKELAEETNELSLSPSAKEICGM